MQQKSQTLIGMLLDALQTAPTPGAMQSAIDSYVMLLDVAPVSQQPVRSPREGNA